jgi:hypothetical protein
VVSAEAVLAVMAHPDDAELWAGVFRRYLDKFIQLIAFL